MRRLANPPILLVLLAVSFFAISHAQDQPAAKPHGDASHGDASHGDASQAKRLSIVPLVMLKPGETKELLLSTTCTVGVTRGGGFSLAEMIDGKPAFGQSTLQGARSFSKNGVTISVPDFAEGTKFAAAPEYAALKARGIDAFTVKVTASSTAQPGPIEMHLLDSTCWGDCKTDFRVLVVAP